MFNTARTLSPSSYRGCTLFAATAQSLAWLHVFATHAAYLESLDELLIRVCTQTPGKPYGFPGVYGTICTHEGIF